MRDLIPTTTLRGLQDLPPTGVCLLLRHSHREHIQDGTNGDHVELTAQGVAAAESLGEAFVLAERTTGRMLSSPVSRCVATAAAIARGARWTIEPVKDDRLGHPGAFVAEPGTAFAVYEKLGTRTMVYRQVQGPDPLPGMRPVEEGTRILVDAATAGLHEDQRIDVMVTHDSILAMFLGQLFATLAVLEPWPRFLEGAFLWREGQSVVAAWRGQVRRVTGGVRSTARDRHA